VRFDESFVPVPPGVPYIKQEDELIVRKPLPLISLCCALAVVVLGFPAETNAQFNPAIDTSSFQTRSEALPDAPSPASSSDSAVPDAYAAPGEPAGGTHEDPWTPPGMEIHYGKFSRAAVGGGISLLGIGVRGGVILAERLDGRLDAGFFFYHRNRIEVNGWNVNADIHMDSIGAKFDWYPFNNPWRITPGVMFYNGNRLSGTIRLAGGTNITLDGKDYYSAYPNPATGATELTGTATFGLNPRKPAFTLATGFGRMIPHSRRHWSFPTEFGVSFTGSPTINVTAGGWVCKDKKQTLCSDLSKSSNPLTIAFNNSLDNQLAKWRRDLHKAPIFPIFTAGVMYSFDLPWKQEAR
jgi:hypothetical protein